MNGIVDIYHTRANAVVVFASLLATVAAYAIACLSDFKLI